MGEVAAGWSAAVDGLLFIDGVPGEIYFSFVLLWIGIAAIYFTLRFGFIGIRLIPHGWNVLLGRYPKITSDGDMTLYQTLALSSSGGAGLATIVGTAVVVMGAGPGSVFWMFIAGLFMLHIKFVEVVLGHIHREKRPDKTMMGGAMYYFSRGFAVNRMPSTGQLFAIFFSVLGVITALSFGSAFQVSQVLAVVKTEIDIVATWPWLPSVIFVLVSLALLRRTDGGIAYLSAQLMPLSVLVYVLMCVFVIGHHLEQLLEVFKHIIKHAFNPESALSGIAVVIMVGVLQTVVSAQVGTGMSSIAHAGSNEQYSVRQGAAALYEIIINIFIIGFLTSLVLLLTTNSDSSTVQALVAADEGGLLLLNAFSTVVPWFSWILMIVMVMFAITAIIFWYYVGERCWTYLAGDGFSLIFRVIFLGFMFSATYMSIQTVFELSYFHLLTLALVNMVGLYVLQGDVWGEVREYASRLKNGELVREVG